MLKSRIQENLNVLTEAIAKKDALLIRSMVLKEDAVMTGLSDAQQQVSLLRLELGDKWPDPDVMDSYVFLVSEVGELGDALLRRDHGHRGDYVRNNPKQADLNAELGDVFLMLCTLATCLDIDLDCALQDCIDKLRSKYGVSESSN